MILYKIGWTLLSIALYCLGGEIICPFIDSSLLKGNSIFLNNLLRSLAEFSGGRFDNASIFALGIGPYINASILTSALFKTSEYLMNKKKYEDPNIVSRYTRIITLPIAALQALYLTFSLLQAADQYPEIIVGFNVVNLYSRFAFIFLTVVTLVANTMFLTWLSEFITERGIGSGSSVLIATNILAHGFRDWEVVKAQTPWKWMLASFAVLITIVCFIELSYRKLVLIYCKGQEKDRYRQNLVTYLPIKFNPAGILPVIFASQISITSRGIFNWARNKFGVINLLLLQLPTGTERILIQLSPLVVSALLIMFSYVYLDVFGSPDELDKQIHSRSGYIEGIRPGIQTQKYITYVSQRMALFGGIYLAFVYHFNSVVSYILKCQFPGMFNGSSTIICVVIILEMISQLGAAILSTLYMKKRNLGKTIL